MLLLNVCAAIDKHESCLNTGDQSLIVVVTNAIAGPVIESLLLMTIFHRDVRAGEGTCRARKLGVRQSPVLSKSKGPRLPVDLLRPSYPTSPFRASSAGSEGSR